MELIPIAIFWLMLAYGMVNRGPFIFAFLFCSMSFGSFSVIPPELTQKMSFTPPPIIALAIIVMYAGGRNGPGRILDLALRPSQCLLLFLFLITAIWTTIFMPRIFAGAVDVIPMRLEDGTYTAAPLYPTPQNISQLMYLVISILTALACALAFRSPVTRQHMLVGLCLGGAMVVFTGLLDLIGLGASLDIFRTAAYDYLTDVEIANVKRIVGLMPEASAYGALSVSFLTAIYFFRRAIATRWIRRIAAPCLVVLLVLFSLLSTSSAAYGGLAVFGCMAVAEWAWRWLMTPRGSLAREGLLVEFWSFVLGLSAVYLLLLTVPALFDPFARLIDTIIFQKTASDSYEERSMWTAVSLSALVETFGLGVGVGSTRASNGIVAVFSNCGVIGGLFFYGFVLQTLLRRSPTGGDIDKGLLNAVRYYLPPVIIIGALAGTTPDFGIMNACVFGLAAAVAWPGRSALRGPASLSALRGPAGTASDPHAQKVPV
jgi:hypothetical protein